MKVPAIIDCDPGHDDVMAILLGARTLDLRGITTVHGNASLANTTRNARQTVEFAGLTSIPIAAGQPRPLVRTPHYAPEVHGKTGLDGPTLLPPTVALHPQHAVDFLLAQSHALPGLHLLPIGPLTNIATALVQDPSFAGRVQQISLMGGSLTFGNVTPAAEFNIWCDPEAAHVVFSSGIPIKMIGLNVTHQVLATPARRAQIRAIGRQSTTHVADMLDFYSAGETAYTGLSGGSMHDPLAVAALIDPTILTFEPMHVTVELTGSQTAGMTLCDGRHLGPNLRALKRRTRGEPPNAEVAVAVDADRFWELFLDVLATYP
ncbi:MAG: nucleoside hydrolase [Kouleothrix sp.]|jgi:inosine-uridine nucleoside N-ribohydrolase|nr:nucleoside hydrolase [Kouleothrix sp.]